MWYKVFERAVADFNQTSQLTLGQKLGTHCKNVYQLYKRDENQWPSPFYLTVALVAAFQLALEGHSLYPLQPTCLDKVGTWPLKALQGPDSLKKLYTVAVWLRTTKC